MDYEDLRGLIEGFGSVRGPPRYTIVLVTVLGKPCCFLQTLPFSPLQFEALDLLSASQVAQLAARSGALNNADLIRLVFDRLDGDNALQDVGEFLTALLRTSQVCSRH